MMVLCGDYVERPPRDLSPGDEVIVLGRGTNGGILGHRAYQKSQLREVTATAPEEAVVVTLTGGGRLRLPRQAELWGASRAGWTPVTRLAGREVRHLGRPPKRKDRLFARGWVAGVADGDGSFWWHDRKYRRFRLVKPGAEVLLARFYGALPSFDLDASWGRCVWTRNGEKREAPAVWIRRHAEASRLEALVLADVDHPRWRWGYLSGLMDTDGSGSGGELAWYQTRERVRERLLRVAASVGVGLHPAVYGFRAFGLIHPARVMVEMGLSSTHKTDAVVLRRAGGWIRVERVREGRRPLQGWRLVPEVGEAIVVGGLPVRCPVGRGA